MISILLSFNPILRVFRREKRVSGQATPRRDIFSGAGIGRRDSQSLAGLHPAQAQAELQDKIPAGHIACVPALACA
jgi:hypothetical protein